MDDSESGSKELHLRRPAPATDDTGPSIDTPKVHYQKSTRHTERADYDAVTAWLQERWRWIAAFAVVAATIVVAIGPSKVWQFVYLLGYPYCILEDDPAIEGPQPIGHHERQELPSPISVLDIVYVTAFPQNLLSSVRSLCWFMDTSGVGTVHLIVPDRMERYFNDNTARLQCEATGYAGQPRRRLNFAVWPESKLVPAFTRQAHHGGTIRQMTLKMAAATIVNTPFYLVMDSDVYARLPFNVSSLFEPGSGRRAKTNLDQPGFRQGASWHTESARVLQTALVKDTMEYCAEVAYKHGQGAWFASSGSSAVPDRPFELLPQGHRGRTVYGACHEGRGHATHVTPMILSRDIVTDILVPRLEAVGSSMPSAGNVRGKGSTSGTTPSLKWYDVLLDYHDTRAEECRQGHSPGRFYTWTEYGLYQTAAVAGGAMDSYHVFREGGTTSFDHSIMSPEQYDAADWDAIFTDTNDPAPLFLVHSWFGKPVETTNAHLAQHVHSMQDPASWTLPAAPSPEPLYEDRKRGGGAAVAVEPAG